MTTHTRTTVSGWVALAVLSGAVYLAAQPNPARVPAGADDSVVIHVLNRLGFGPTAGAVQRVRQLGVAAYIEEQLHPERIADGSLEPRLAGFSTLTKSTRQLANDYYLPALMERRARQRSAASAATPGGDPPQTPEPTENVRLQRTVAAELSQQRILRAAYSERQLQEVLVDFWFNHFNVFAGKGAVRIYLTEYERDVIRPHVLGTFRELLGATASSPAMLFYLDNWQSSAAPGARTSDEPPPRFGPRRQTFNRPDARGQVRRRGLNENYARELMELHTLGVDGGYTQKDIQEVARAFTGWTIDTPRLGGAFRFDPRLHDDGDKVVLGRRIPGGGGRKDGEEVLDLLAKHPSTARFIATKLARRFVSDDPPPALVERAGDRFRQTGGNIREVVRTIVTSPEFFAREAYRAKVKNPLEFVVSAVRALGVDVASALPLAQAVRELGMPIYGAQPPTGYVDRAGTWVNSGALLNRMNFAISLGNGRMRAFRHASDIRSLPADEARRALISTALAGDVSESTAATAARADTTPQAIALLLGSPEFQKR
jgi:uncharacterized protein (DUF1800 family)